MDSFKQGSSTRNSIAVFNKILATCRQQPTLEEYHTVVESFADFLDIVNEKGHIDDEQYDIRGIRMDKDINGQDVFRTAGIAQESFQRSNVSLTFTKSICVSNDFK